MDATTFDYAEMFSGVSYPTEEVTVYTNAGLAAEIARVNKEIVSEITGDNDKEKLAALEKQATDLYAKAEQFRFTFHLRGVRRELRVSLSKDIEEKHPAEHDFLGREKFNIDRAEYAENATWALYIERIVRGSDGATIAAPSPEGVALIRGNLPDSESDKITKGIKALAENVETGIEAIAAEHDFLSQP